MVKEFVISLTVRINALPGLARIRIQAISVMKARGTDKRIMIPSPMVLIIGYFLLLYLLI